MRINFTISLFIIMFHKYYFLHIININHYTHIKSLTNIYIIDFYIYFSFYYNISFALKYKYLTLF